MYAGEQVNLSKVDLYKPNMGTVKIITPNQVIVSRTVGYA